MKSSTIKAKISKTIDSKVTLKDIMTRNISCIKTGSTLLEATKQLNRTRRVEGLPVIDSNNKPIGAFTKNHVIEAVSEGYDLSEKIDAFINPNVWVVHESTSLEDLIWLTTSSPYGMGIVVDGYEKVTGVFSKKDAIMAFFKNNEILFGQTEALFKASYNYILVTNFEGKIITANKAIGNIFNHDIHNKSVYEVFPNLGKLIDMVHNTKKQKVAQTVKIDGDTNKYYVNINPIIHHNKVLGAISVLQQLEDLEVLAKELKTYKKVFSTLDTILNNFYDAIIIVDKNGEICYANRSFTNLIDGKQVIGSDIELLMPKLELHNIAQQNYTICNETFTHNNEDYKINCFPLINNHDSFGAVGIISLQKLEVEKESSTNFMPLKIYTHNSKPSNHSSSDIITTNPKLLHILELAKNIAKNDSTVLIQGESGTGKDLLAQAIHNNSYRSHKPFIVVNCAAVPENLLESEFFGYEEGAFSGARKQGKPGKFELANNGTIFLDEIGDMSVALQSKLLKVLQDKSFERIGGSKTININTRIIAATNQDLEERISANTFRSDLYYRLNVVKFHLPPLRERISDIPLLIIKFIEEYNSKFNKNVSDITREALSIMMNYGWPGNVRELKHMVEMMMNFCDREVITASYLPNYIVNSSSLDYLNSKLSSLNEKKSNHEKEEIISVLEKNQWNKSKTAIELGISRTSLYNKIRKYSL